MLKPRGDADIWLLLNHILVKYYKFLLLTRISSGLMEHFNFTRTETLPLTYNAFSPPSVLLFSYLLQRSHGKL